MEKRTRELQIAFGHIVDERRKELKLNQVELSERVGYNPSHMSRILLGKRNLTFATVAKIAEALGIQIKFTVRTVK